MKDTPRTDAKESETEDGGMERHAYYGWKFARALERELAEKDKEIKHSWVAGARHESMCRSEEIKALKSEIAADDRNVNNLMDQIHAMSREREFARRSR